MIQLHKHFTEHLNTLSDGNTVIFTNLRELDEEIDTTLVPVR